MIGGRTFPLIADLPVTIIRAGPVEFTTALTLAYCQLPFVVFEADASLAMETEAGTTLTLTNEYSVRVNVPERGIGATPIFMHVSSKEGRDFSRNSNRIGDPEGVIPTLLYLISEASANLTDAMIEDRLSPVDVAAN